MMDGTGIRFALADDHALMRQVTIACLRTYGYELLFEAEDGQDLIEQLERSKDLPDVVIVDLQMPRMNGIEAARIISSRWPQIKIIGFTNMDDPTLRADMLRAGADTCIRKTDAPHNLHTAVITSFFPNQKHTRL